MDAGTSQRLLEINRQFYQTFALQFSATRHRIQPGVRRVIERLPLQASLLDLGCGNGELWRELSHRGHTGPYIGLDLSPGLLSEASQGAAEGKARFIQADLSARDWDASLDGMSFDAVLAFAVLHHLPGDELRQQVLRKGRGRLRPGGQLIHSEWQFLNSARLRGRILPWSEAGLDASQVDAGDYLLDWRQGGSGIRYVHHFYEAELSVLAAATGFRVLETFYSDGEGGRLGLYQVWG